MIDRPEAGEAVFLVDVQFYPASHATHSLNELRELIRSAGFCPAGEMTVSRSTPDPRFLVGSGKVQEIKQAVLSHQAELVVISTPLAPAQQRNLEKSLDCRVMDRTELILVIFARRARSFEGQLQVELATLKHQSTRLVRGWTHLERQRGGIGVRGGPGETQLETDRRLIRSRMRQVADRLDKVRAQRAEGRKARQRAAIPTIALVGYTNAGKSTLFNRLTGAKVYAADQLFATLDPTMRRVRIPELGPVVFADTVGFIRDLPPDLVRAFRATLEEVTEATLLLHVVDVSDPNRQQHLTNVQTVLEDIGAGAIPQLLVYNKVDISGDSGSVADVVPSSVFARLFTSAKDGVGLTDILSIISTQLIGEKIQRSFLIADGDTDLLAKLYQQRAVLSVEDVGDGYLRVTARLSSSEWEGIDRVFGQY